VWIIFQSSDWSILNSKISRFKDTHAIDIAPFLIMIILLPLGYLSGAIYRATGNEIFEFIAALSVVASILSVAIHSMVMAYGRFMRPVWYNRLNPQQE
jgi:hypothetical protein